MKCNTKRLHSLSKGGKWAHIDSVWRSMQWQLVWLLLNFPMWHGSMDPRLPWAFQINPKTASDLFLGFHISFLSLDFFAVFPKDCVVYGCWNLEPLQWWGRQSGCPRKNARHLESVHRGCNVPRWPTGWLYPVLSFFYSLQTPLVFFFSSPE